ncbi:MAG: DUF72 domain-containing protein [Deltaproteobacteria bacterium]
MNYIGTSGWYYKHWADGVFYPKGLAKGKWLAYYTGFFDCVELNVTFYRLVSGSTFAKWRTSTPDDFRFVAKGSRFISHNKKIANVKEPLAVFFKRAKELKGKLAAVLWQFSPRFRVDLPHLEAFLDLLDKTGYRQVFEFRHPSWFDEEVYAALKAHNACLCIAHSPGNFPVYRKATADFIYLRFHGGEKLYGSEYSVEELKEWAEFARGFGGRDIFAFFNNDAHGYAVKNALEFKKLLSGRR